MRSTARIIIRPEPSRSRGGRKAATYRAVGAARVTPEYVHRLRVRLKEQEGWGVREVARRIRIFAPGLRLSHTQLIFIEQGKRPITEKFSNALRELEREYPAAHGATGETEAITLICKYPLPTQRVHLLRRVVHCSTPGCGAWFEQVNARHRKCSPTCKPAKTFRRKEERSRRRGKR